MAKPPPSAPTMSKNNQAPPPPPPATAAAPPPPPPTTAAAPPPKPMKKLSDSLKALLLEKMQRCQKHEQHQLQEERRETSVGGADCSATVQQCMYEIIPDQSFCIAMFC